LAMQSDPSATDVSLLASLHFFRLRLVVFLAAFLVALPFLTLILLSPATPSSSSSLLSAASSSSP